MLGLNKHAGILKPLDLNAIKWCYRTVGDYGPEKWDQSLLLLNNAHIGQYFELIKLNDSDLIQYCQ